MSEEDVFVVPDWDTNSKELQFETPSRVAQKRSTSFILGHAHYEM